MKAIWLFPLILLVTVVLNEAVEYEHQVILKIGEEKVVNDAADFLYKKHASTLDSYMFQYDKGNLEQLGEKKKMNVDWKKTKIQIVAHGNSKTVGKLSPEKLAGVVIKFTNGESPNKISLVSCMLDSGCELHNMAAPPDYLKEFGDQLNTNNIRSTEISGRSTLVSVDNNGRKLTGKVFHSNSIIYNSRHNPRIDQTTGDFVLKKDEGGIEWSHKDHDVKWITKISESGVISNDKAPVTDRKVTRFIGVVPKGQDVYLTNVDTQETHTITDDIAFELLNEVANKVNKKAKNSKPTNEKEYSTSMITNTDGKPTFSEKKMMLREINGVEDFENELRYRSEEFKINPSTGTVHYRFGSFVVSMSLENFYINVNGIITSDFSSSELNDIKNKWPYVNHEGYSFSKEYSKMKPAIGADFTQHVKSWINGKNEDIRTNPGDFIEHAYNAQCGAAMFLAESIRNFHNHLTNMICLQMIDANIMSMEHFIRDDINPMARGSTWLRKKEAGTNYMDYLEAEPDDNKVAKQYLEEIKTRLSRLYKTFIAHMETNSEVGSIDRPPQAQSSNKPSGDIFQTRNKYPLRGYEQKFPDRLLSTEISEPVIQSIDTQRKEFSRTEDVVAPLRVSMALAYDHAYISKAIADVLKKEEKEMNKPLEIEPESMKVIVEGGKGTSIELSAHNKENPAENKIIQVSIDESKLSSNEMIDNHQKQADAVKNIPSEKSRTTNRINKVLGIYGVVAGFRGAINKLEGGEYVEGSIYLAQSFHGLGDLTGINNKIWQASKQFMKRALQKPLDKLSKSAVVREGEKIVEREISNVIGKVDLDSLDKIPIVGTAFGIYIIVEDFKQHNTLGYIDGGLDIAITGLSFLGPEVEPIIIALTFIRMGMDTFYNDISKEISSLPEDVSLIDKVGAVFKGIEDSVIDLYEQFTLLSQIIGAIENSNKLDQAYAEQQEYLHHLTDFNNYYGIVNESGDSKHQKISFAEGSLFLKGGGIQFTLGESGESELSIEVFDSKLKQTTQTIDTKGVEDITMGIGESYSFNFTKQSVNFFFFVPIDTKWMISGNQTDKRSLHGEYTGNSQDNSFYAVQDLPSKLSIDYKLNEYHYILHGRGGDDFFYLGPQVTFVEGNEGSDTYYITNNTTTTDINNFAEDHEADYLIMSQNIEDIELKREGNNAILWSTENSKTHLVKLDAWFLSEDYRHLTVKTKDRLLSNISATGKNDELELLPIAFNGGDAKKGLTFDAKERPSVLTLTGSSHDDHLLGNDLDNHIYGKGGSDKMTGQNGKDLYLLGDNKNARVIINNFASDRKTDLLLTCAKTHQDIELAADDNNLIITSSNCESSVTIENWFLGEDQRHMFLVSEDGEVANISSSREELKLHVLMVDLSVQSEHDLSLNVNSNIKLTEDLNVRHNLEFEKYIDLSKDPGLKQVVSVSGSELPDLIFGNKRDNYISGGKGEDHLYGWEGKDVYVIKQGDGMNYIYQIFDGDKKIDTILFDANYDHIELSDEDNSLVIHAYKSSQEKYLAVRLSCLLTEPLYTEEIYTFNGTLDNCFSLNSLYYIRTNDGIMFKLPTDEKLPLVKVPLLVDYSKSPQGLTLVFTQECEQVQRFQGSNYKDDILGNPLDNYIDPGVGGSYMQGRNGSDTYVLRHGYGSANNIYNIAGDYKLDTLRFLVAFDTIETKVDNKNNLVMTSVGSKNGKVGVTFDEFANDDASRHLVVVTEDGITFALSPKKDYAPTPIAINKAQENIGQFINLTSIPNFSEVKTIYAAKNYQNHIVGNKQKNTLVGGVKADLLEGLDGDDVLKGKAGNDTLDGGPGVDTLVGGLGNDTLKGGDGDDIIAPGPGQNLVYGGDGTDTVMYNEGVGIQALLHTNKIYHRTPDQVYEVENVIGTEFNDILHGDDQDNVLTGKGGDDKLYTGKSGYDILDGGNGSDVYSWNNVVTFISNSTMIVINYATDGKVDTIENNITVHNRSEIGFEKTGYDLVIRPINKKYPVFYEFNPIIILKAWFHPDHPALYRHLKMELADELLDCDRMETLGEEALKREIMVKNTTSY